MNQKRFTLWYFAVSFIFIIFENLYLILPALISKALIIPSLMIFYHFTVRGRYGLFHQIIMASLFFSWVGDVALQFADGIILSIASPDLFFLIGLGSFLIAHIIYFIAFSIPKGKNSIFNTRIYQTVLVLIYGFIMLYFLYRRLGDMKIPVIIYTAIILLMLLSALNRYGKVNGISYVLVVCGALLFVISDSLIAITRFQMKIDFAGTIIMITYVTAQYLIVLGCIRQNILTQKTD
jgi:uncharacterized membrane protein YhhN